MIVIAEFTDKQIEFINEGKMATVGVISPTTHFPHLTPTGVAYHNGKLYIGMKTDTAKYRFIKHGSDKVGISIFDPSKFSYISVTGTATILYQETTQDYQQLFRCINANYLPEETVDDRVETIVQEGDWVLMEVTPSKIISIGQRGGSI